MEKSFPTIGKLFRRPPPVAGFSLIELLVVIAAGSLLLLLAAGAGRMALRAAQSAACRDHLRQLAAANTAYATDHGRYVAAAADMDGANTQRWHGRRSGGVFDAAEGPLTPYLGGGGGSVQIRRCPAFHPAAGGFEASCGGFGYNAAGVGSVEYMPEDNEGGGADAFKHLGMRPAALTYPATTIMFTDTAYVQGSGAKAKIIEYSFCEPYSRPGGGSQPWPTIHFRHGGAANVVWCDGHISRESRSQTGARGAEAGLGWFGPADNRYFEPF